VGSLFGLALASRSVVAALDGSASSPSLGLSALKPYSDTGCPMTAALAAKTAQSLAPETSSFERSLTVTEAPRSVSLSRI